MPKDIAAAHGGQVKDAPPAASNNHTKRSNQSNDEQYYDIEDVLDFRQDLEGNDEFLIRWKGFGAASDSWEPPHHLSKYALEIAKACQQEREATKSSISLTDQGKNKATTVIPVPKSLEASRGTKQAVGADLDRKRKAEQTAEGKKKRQQIVIDLLGDSSDEDSPPAKLSASRDSRKMTGLDSDRVAVQQLPTVQRKLVAPKMSLKSPLHPPATAACQPKHRLYVSTREPAPAAFAASSSLASPIESSSAAAATLSKREKSNKQSRSSSYSSRVSIATIMTTAGSALFKNELQYRSIERIHVNDPSASDRVTEARLAGIPVVIVGHTGWAQFSARWLKNCPPNEFLDLSKNYELDLVAMQQDIGDEEVPLVQENYDEYEPIKEAKVVHYFLDKYWKTNSNEKYLHQWQFPLSETAVPKLCGRGKNIPLPVLGDDLLQHWQVGDCPLQYIFMGPEQTMSKMHRDTGGLMITIAPIVGTKEVVLLHRADAASCFSKLEAKVEEPDFDKFPLMPFARVWKSTLCPGEILIMPQGTYHQCRNVAPCLSYSRFFLDSVNLRAFFESFIARDTEGIDHDEVVYNALCELGPQIRNYIKDRQPTTASNCPRMAAIIKELVALRQVGQAMYLHYIQEERWDQVDSWANLLQETEQYLHDYKFRNTFNAPVVSAKQSGRSSEASSDGIRGHMGKRPLNEGQPSCIIGQGISRLAKVPRDLLHYTLPDSVSLGTGDRVRIRLHGHLVEAEILRKRELMSAAFVHYEEYESVEDEWRQASDLRVAVPGESSACADFHSLKIGNLVSVNDQGVEYAARILALKSCSFYLLQLRIDRKRGGGGTAEQWHIRETIVEKLTAKSG